MITEYLCFFQFLNLSSVSWTFQGESLLCLHEPSGSHFETKTEHLVSSSEVNMSKYSNIRESGPRFLFPQRHFLKSQPNMSGHVLVASLDICPPRPPCNGSVSGSCNWKKVIGLNYLKVQLNLFYTLNHILFTLLICALNVSVS